MDYTLHEGKVFCGWFNAIFRYSWNFAALVTVCWSSERKR